HCVRPPYSVVVVGVATTEFVQVLNQILRRFEGCHAVEISHLIEGSVECSFSRGTIVPYDVNHKGLIKYSEILQSVDQFANMVVDKLEESCVAFHFAPEHWLQVLWHRVPCGDLLVPHSQLRIVRDNSKLFLFCEGTFA